MFSLAWSGAQRVCFDSRLGFQRWHFQHGPIDLIIGVHGESALVVPLLEKAWRRFETILPELTDQLPNLQRAVQVDLRGQPMQPLAMQPEKLTTVCQGEVASRMVAACVPYVRVDGVFVTPMAAVAGSVAEEVLSQLSHPGVNKAWVNNGGDIAWYCAGVDTFNVGLAEVRGLPNLSVASNLEAWGVATSGWRGRSQSFGIADSVTVLASSATQADVAATLIANRVSLSGYEGQECPLEREHPAIFRKPANQVKDLTDLGERLVTVGVGRLSPSDVALALDFGQHYAQLLLDRGWIKGAILILQEQFRVCGPPELLG